MEFEGRAQESFGLAFTPFHHEDLRLQELLFGGFNRRLRGPAVGFESVAPAPLFPVEKRQTAMRVGQRRAELHGLL